MDVTVSPLACGTDCPLGFSSSPGNALTTGFCNFKCGTTWATTQVTCKTANADISALKTSFACQTNFIKDFYRCFSNTQDDLSALHFSKYYNSPPINIGSSVLNLSNYIIDIWYLPDTRYMDWTVAGPLYIFATNKISLYRNNKLAGTSTHNFKYDDQTSSGFDLDSKYHWNKLTFKVSVSGTTYTALFYQNHFSVSTTYTLTKTTGTVTKLTDICFCQSGTACNCGNGLNWVSGYYRNLRVFDSTTILNGITDFQNYDY